jgi:hypothetical protein
MRDARRAAEDAKAAFVKFMHTSCIEPVSENCVAVDRDLSVAYNQLVSVSWWRRFRWRNINGTGESWGREDGLLRHWADAIIEHTSQWYKPWCKSRQEVDSTDGLYKVVPPSAKSEDSVLRGVTCKHINRSR